MTPTFVASLRSLELQNCRPDPVNRYYTESRMTSPQLPKADRNSKLERESIAALQARLPADKFVFRREGTDDAGVDGSLELLMDGNYTNLRSQVQLKATDATRTNEDGSVSLSVQVANLNYLLNGPSPIYILFISPKNELRFAWARDERGRLDNSNPNWSAQDTVTLRFMSVLDNAALVSIHDRIRQETQFQRKVADLLIESANLNSVAIRIDPKSLSVTDHEKARQLLIESGTAIVSSGYIREAKNLLSLLSAAETREPRILLVQAHIEFNQQRYDSALAIIQELSLHTAALSEEERVFLETMRDSSNFQTGRIDLAEFRRRLQSTDKSAGGRFALSNTLEQKRYTMIGERDPDRRTVLLKDFEAFVAKIVASDVSPILKVHSRIYLVEAIGQHMLLKFVREVADARIRLEMSRPTNLRQLFDSHAVAISEWDSEARAVLKDAIDLGNPFLIATAMVTRGNTSYGLLNDQKILALMFDKEPEFSSEFIQSNIDNANHAVTVFLQAGNLEGELRARMLVADIYDLVGRRAEAEAIAKEVLPKAKAMNYSALRNRAEEYLSGQSLQDKMLDSVRKKTREEQIITHAEQPDDELRRNAKQMLRILGLPVDRLPVLEREYESFRGIAREQLTWCRYLELVQDKRHELHPETHYRVDPTRRCICSLLGLISAIGNSDWPSVVRAFKIAHCQSCSKRAPIKRET